EAANKEISLAAHRQQTLLCLGMPAAEAAPQILQALADGLDGCIQRDDQFVKNQNRPRVAALAQIAQKTDGHVRGGIADVLAGADASKVGDFNAGMDHDLIALADADR